MPKNLLIIYIFNHLTLSVLDECYSETCRGHYMDLVSMFVLC